MVDQRTGAKLRRAQGYFTVQDLAESLRINQWSIYDHIKAGNIRKPRLTLGRRRYYTSREVEEIKEQFKEGIEQ